LDFMDYVLSLIRVLDHLQWKSCYYIGHSLGGQLGLYLCSLWPQRVKRLVLLDTVGPFYTKTNSYLSHNRLLLDNILRTEEQFSSKKRPVYTYQEALDRIMTSRYSILTKEAAKIMIKRSLRKISDEGFMFTPDQRLKARLTSLLNEEQQLQVCATFVDMKYKYSFKDKQF
jgi:Predicted hydrolases or acyltransferases (alpha/beta hydrolase superfamily)